MSNKLSWNSISFSYTSFLLTSSPINKYNLKLSLDRAKSVQSTLIKLGINNNNIKIMAKGESEPAFQTNDEVAHPANRRVEVSSIN